uniref:Protein G12 n=1 Tax=Heterorhabditis bacteriophora TaxID=37862 RepID=A0A1I7X1C2_HETBA
MFVKLAFVLNSSTVLDHLEEKSRQAFFYMFRIALVLLFFSYITISSCHLDIDKLSGNSKKFFMDMTKQVMGVPSLKPENLAAQSFFRSFLDKYTKLDDKIKKDLIQHVPTATKIFDKAGNLAQQGINMAGKLLKGT